ncbi:hypothetical protein GCM10020295_73060 [Streptomyces cinereospinus]
MLTPGLLSYWLTGEQGTELANASTTQFGGPRTRDWSYGVAARPGVGSRPALPCTRRMIDPEEPRCVSPCS